MAGFTLPPHDFCRLAVLTCPSKFTTYLESDSENLIVDTALKRVVIKINRAPAPGNVFHVKQYRLFSNAESAKYLAKQIICRKLPRNLTKRSLCQTQLFGKQLCASQGNMCLIQVALSQQ
jgi:hypothetical protein